MFGGKVETDEVSKLMFQLKHRKRGNRPRLLTALYLKRTSTERSNSRNSDQEQPWLEIAIESLLEIQEHL